MKLSEREKKIRKGVKLVRKGASFTAAAKAVGISYRSLRHRLAELGLEPAKTPSLAEQAAELVCSNWFTPRQAAQEIGLASVTGVYRSLRGKEWKRERPTNSHLQSTNMEKAVLAVRRGMSVPEAAAKHGVLPNSLAWHASPNVTEVE